MKMLSGPIKTDRWVPAVGAELDVMFRSMKITEPDRIERDVRRALGNIDRYRRLVTGLGGEIPWWFVAAVHSLEASFSFNRHLHNGDPLEARTVNVPRGRPMVGKPTFSWEESARDALCMPGKEFHLQRSWGISRTLWLLEGFNGYGYRMYRGIYSPYLWAGTAFYTKGKYIADGVYSADAISLQTGVAPLIKRLIEEAGQ